MLCSSLSTWRKHCKDHATCVWVHDKTEIIHILIVSKKLYKTRITQASLSTDAVSSTNPSEVARLPVNWTWRSHAQSDSSVCVCEHLAGTLLAAWHHRQTSSLKSQGFPGHFYESKKRVCHKNLKVQKCFEIKKETGIVLVGLSTTCALVKS